MHMLSAWGPSDAIFAHSERPPGTIIKGISQRWPACRRVGYLTSKTTATACRIPRASCGSPRPSHAPSMQSFVARLSCQRSATRWSNAAAVARQCQTLSLKRSPSPSSRRCRKRSASSTRSGTYLTIRFYHSLTWRSLCRTSTNEPLEPQYETPQLLLLRLGQRLIHGHKVGVDVLEKDPPVSGRCRVVVDDQTQRRRRLRRHGLGILPGETVRVVRVNPAQRS